MNTEEKDISTERNICTLESPYSKDKGGRWQHPDAIEISEDYGKGGGVADGDYIQYECPNCKLKFWVELPN